MTDDTMLHVIFGAGPVGRWTAAALLRRGRAVRVVSRRGVPADFPKGIEDRRADASDPEAARDACRGAAVVYQCAQPPYHLWSVAFPALQDAILKATRHAGARLVAAENVYMYGAVDRPMTEAMPHAAQTRKGRIRAEMTALLFAAHARGELPVATGRASDLFGPWMRQSALGERTFGPLVSGGSAETYGDPDQPHTWTYVEDFGEALAVLGERPEAPGQAWHVPNAPAISAQALLERAFAMMDRPVRIGRTGRLKLMIGGLFVPAAREMVEMAYEFDRPFVVDHARWTATFGTQATATDVALRRTLDWYAAALTSSSAVPADA